MTGNRNLFQMSAKRMISAVCLVVMLTAAFACTAFAVGPGESNSVIGESKAKEYAYADAGVDAAAVESCRVERDYENGQSVYELDFYAGGAEYDYHVRVSDGAILKKEVELMRTDGSRVRATAQIMADKAKELALADAGLSADSVVFIKAVLDMDDGVSVYDVEFCSDTTEYDYEIDSNTGAVVKKSSEPTRDASGKRYDANRAPEPGTAVTGGNGPSSASAAAGNHYIDVESAKSAALAHAGLSAGDVTFTKAKLDYDDGYVEYEIEFRRGRMEYEYTVNALTGGILEADADWDD